MIRLKFGPLKTAGQIDSEISATVAQWDFSSGIPPTLIRDKDNKLRPGFVPKVVMK